MPIGYFAAPAASDFLDGQKVTKEPLGGGRNRQKRLRRPCLHAARPLGPRYGGRVPAKLSGISGAQNLSDYSKFLPGHRALSERKISVVRSRFCAWVSQPAVRGAVAPELGRLVRQTEARQLKCEP